jgi:hypothetical protein
MASTVHRGVHCRELASHYQSNGSCSGLEIRAQPIQSSIQGDLRLHATSICHAQTHSARSKAFVDIRRYAWPNRGGLRLWKPIAPLQSFPHGNGAASRRMASSQCGISGARLDAKRFEGLPHAAQCHRDRLAIHSPGGIGAQERDHLSDLARLKHPILRVDGGALLPHLLDADAAPFGLRLR